MIFTTRRITLKHPTKRADYVFYHHLICRLKASVALSTVTTVSLLCGTPFWGTTIPLQTKATLGRAQRQPQPACNGVGLFSNLPTILIGSVMSMFLAFGY